MMDKHLKKIYYLNFFSIFLTAIYGYYLLSHVIYRLYRHIDDIRISATVLIPLVSIILINLFYFSNRSIGRGLYERNRQKVATIFLVTYIAASDILVIYAFGTFIIYGKILFILINIVTLLHARRYFLRFFIKRNE